MATDLTPSRLTELLEAATPGPWTAHVKNTGYVWGVDNSPGLNPPGTVQVAQVGAYRDKESLPWCKERWDADKALIALSPALASRVIELEAEVLELCRAREAGKKLEADLRMRGGNKYGDAIRAALEPLSGCQLTEQGAEITTHCLYPSFEPVKVYVVGYGAGFIVHDGGGALKSAWDHGREFNAALTAQMNREARRYGLTAADGQIQVQIENHDWLASAILSVANASSAAVHHVTERAAQNAESDLKGRIRETSSRPRGSE